MTIKFEISVVQVSSSLRVTIPKEICEHIGLRKGDKISMWIDDHHITIEKKEGKFNEPKN
jgi:AbrB family looped-hinge helix DNA binding protein